MGGADQGERRDRRLIELVVYDAASMHNVIAGPAQ